jgi:spore coat protein U-like protein
MKLTKLSLVLASFSALFVATGGVALADPSGKVQVTAGVSAHCVVSFAGDITFGDYNPVAGSPTTTTGDLKIACTKGAAPTITLDWGKNGGSGLYNYMVGTKGDKLEYQIFQPTMPGDAQSSTQWNGTPNTLTGPAATSIAAVTYTMFGQIPINQDVRIDTYSDTVTVTINL